MEKATYSGKRILIVGDFMWPWYQDACADALEYHGCVVKRVGWAKDFTHFVDGKSEPLYHSLLHRIQYRLRIGPLVSKIGRRLVETAETFNPDVVWFYNVTLISPAIVRKLRSSCPSALFVQYANDNPFSKTAKWGIWSNFLRSIPYFDLHCAFRHENIQDLQKWGSLRQFLLRSYFIPEVDYPEPQEAIPDHFKCDVVFAGHYEDDGRIEMLEAVCNAGFTLKLYGGGWTSALSKLSSDSPLRTLFPVTPATGPDYRYAICGAKVALCFLSKINKDTYTTRCFQIPAMKTAMLSQYTDDLATLFKEDVEAVFFKTENELIDKLQNLVGNESIRRAIADSGYSRVYADGHDVRSRMHFWLKAIMPVENIF